MILVDDRTGSVELDPHITQPHAICRLEYADFMWSGSGPEGPVSIGVERKGIMDLLNSMESGRLSGHQLIGLTQNYDWVYLLVEGVWRPDRNTGVLMKSGRNGWEAATQGSRRFMARDVFNYFNTLAVMCGVIVVTTSNMWESGRWIDACYGWWSKEWEKHKSHLQFQKPVTHAQLSKPNLVTKIASQFEGVGWDKARKLGVRFKLAEDFLSAGKKELMEVDGIGPKMADSIIDQRNK